MGSKSGNTANYMEDKKSDLKDSRGGFSLNQCRKFFGLPNEAKKRECMRCSRKFMSAHKGHRLCGICPPL